MSINLRIIAKRKQIVEQMIRNFFLTVDFSPVEPQPKSKICKVSNLYNVITRLSFLLPERLSYSPFPVEVIGTLPSINYGLTSHYSGNWNAPRRPWLSRNLPRSDIRRYAVHSGSQDPTKPASEDSKISTTSDDTTKSQDKIKIEEPKISAADFKVSSKSSAAEILDIGAKLAKAKESVAQSKVTNMNATEFGKEDIKKNVSDKELGSVQAKLGVVEAKLSEPPRAKFSGADYALKPKELLKEISQFQQAKTQNKIVIDNASESGFLNKIKKIRLEKWMKFPKARMERYKNKKDPKDEENPKNDSSKPL